jgi:hypothetical protein
VLAIVPTVEFPLETPFTLQVTAVFDVPVTAAVNCCVLPSNTLELDDETKTVTDWGGGGGEVDELFPPQPSKTMRKASEQNSATTSRRLIVILYSARIVLITIRRVNSG